MGLLGTTRNLASLWVETKKIQLQDRGKPNTRVDSGGTRNSYSFDGQEIDRDELRDVRDMRETGGIISHLVHAKAMMQFGTGAEFQAEEDAASEWLHDQFNDLDNLLIDIGEDATWFPYAGAEIVETRGGDFSHVELIEPWTLLPVEDEVGEIIAWEQEIQGDFGATTETFQPDEIASFVLNKSSGRDKTGVSEVLRAEDEVRNFKSNQKTINDALEFLVPHNHWKVGREGGTVIDDNELRRVRNMVQDMQGDTQFITGPDVDHNSIELSKFDIKEITNNDLRQVCVALGVPIELGSVISEGLGSGEQSSVRKTFFELEKRAKQRALGGQFVEQIARQLLDEYSPHDSEQELDLVFQESETLEEKQQVVDAIGEDMTVNERRGVFDLAELDDDEEGEAFEAPGGGSEEGGVGGLFNKAGSEGEYDTESGERFNKEGGSGNLSRALSDAPEWDAHLFQLHQEVFNTDGDRALFSVSDATTPEFVKDRIRDTILTDGVFSDIDGIRDSERMQLREYLLESLTSDGWSVDGVADQLMQLDSVDSREYANLVAESETASILNTSRANGYEERGDADGEKFYWTGATQDEQPERTTTACDWLIKKTHPQHGGTPVSLERLQELIEEAPEHDPDMDSNLARPGNYMVHPRERKTFARHVPGAFS